MIAIASETRTSAQPNRTERMPSRPEPAGWFEGVVKEYPGRGGEPLRALDGIRLRLEVGCATGLVGPNRAGKSTLVRLLLGLSRPTSGRIERLGRPADEVATLSRVGYAHEHPAFPRYRTARGVLRLHAALSGLDRSAARERISDLLSRVGLADRADEPTERFSKGMAQRLALALALLNDPELLVLDEPAEGLDRGGHRLVEEVVDEMRCRNRSVLIVSHQLGDVERLCDRVAVLVGGRLAAEGTVEEVTATHGTRSDLALAVDTLVRRGSRP